MNYDGYVVVQTKLDTKQLEKDISKAKRQLEQYQKEGENLSKQKSKAEIDLRAYEEEKKNIEELAQGQAKLARSEKERQLNIQQTSTLIDNLNQKYAAPLKKYDEINQKIKENELNQGLLNDKIEDMNKKLKQSRGYDNLKDAIKDVGNSVSQVIKKVARWTLAIFGVRTAYMAIRQAMGTLSQYNEQLATDISYIRFALASTLEPLIQKIINLVYTLMQYMNYIWVKWFNKPLFGNASVENFKKANKEAGKLSKTLAGFDELNVVSDSGGGIGGGIAPSVDLSEMEDIKMPSWIKWIADNKELLKELGEILLVAFGAATITKILGNIGRLFGVSGGMGLIGLSEMLLAIAAPVLIVFAVKGVKEVISEGKKLNEYLRNNTDLTKNNNEKQKELNDTIRKKIATGELDEDQTREVVNTYKRWGDENLDLIKGMQNQKTWLGKLTGGNKELEEQQKLVVDEILNNVEAFQELSAQGKTTKEDQRKFNETLYNTIDYLENAGIDATKLKEAYKGLSGEKYTAVVTADTSSAETGLGKVLSKLKEILNIKDINIKGNFSVSGGSGGGGGGGRGFATGAIVNMPGRGVPVASGYMGESGKEGIIPLTDSQAMEELGATIGKYITINANITNTMNGRVISREIQKIQNDSDFAANI